LAEFTANLTFEAIPSEVINHVKVCMMDTLGCALYGSTLPWGKIITDFVKEARRGTSWSLMQQATRILSIDI